MCEIHSELALPPGINYLLEYDDVVADEEQDGENLIKEARFDLPTFAFVPAGMGEQW